VGFSTAVWGAVIAVTVTVNSSYSEGYCKRTDERDGGYLIQLEAELLLSPALSLRFLPFPSNGD